MMLRGSLSLKLRRNSQRFSFSYTLHYNVLDVCTYRTLISRGSHQSSLLAPKILHRNVTG